MAGRLRVWIDLDNSPHVPLFLPIADELRSRGHEVTITARDCFQTCDLLDESGVEYAKIGHHYGKSLPRKAAGLVIRGLQLVGYGRAGRFDVAVSHGSRSLILAGFLLRVPTVNMFDYEHSKFGMLTNAPAKQMMPSAISNEELPRQIDVRRVVKYQGVKEQVFLSRFRPDPTFLQRELGVELNRVVVTMRPPAEEAHYHNPASVELMRHTVTRLLSRPDVVLVVLPRTDSQRNMLAALANGTPGRLVLPEKTLDGLNLVWNSDVVISGGGTMNREAVVLGVPAYSIFRGAAGAVDRSLVRSGRLKMVESAADIDRIPIEKRRRPQVDEYRTADGSTLVGFIADQIVSTAQPDRAGPN